MKQATATLFSLILLIFITSCGQSNSYKDAILAGISNKDKANHWEYSKSGKASFKIHIKEKNKVLLFFFPDEIVLTQDGAEPLTEFAQIARRIVVSMQPKVLRSAKGSEENNLYNWVKDSFKKVLNIPSPYDKFKYEHTYKDMTFVIMNRKKGDKDADIDVNVFKISFN